MTAFLTLGPAEWDRLREALRWRAVTARHPVLAEEYGADAMRAARASLPDLHRAFADYTPEF